MPSMLNMSTVSWAPSPHPRAARLSSVRTVSIPVLPCCVCLRRNSTHRVTITAQQLSPTTAHQRRSNIRQVTFESVVMVHCTHGALRMRSRHMCTASEATELSSAAQPPAPWYQQSCIPTPKSHLQVDSSNERLVCNGRLGTPP
jgi:hypothetical protein